MLIVRLQTFEYLSYFSNNFMTPNQFLVHEFNLEVVDVCLILFCLKNRIGLFHSVSI